MRSAITQASKHAVEFKQADIPTGFFPDGGHSTLMNLDPDLRLIGGELGEGSVGPPLLGILTCD
ncbi:MAG TPA: hypothetical protein VN695_21385 [Streptosporangiaceae bacterium]|nr:hypothetical protein [Streptosporangiaceae bacterium]